MFTICTKCGGKLDKIKYHTSQYGNTCDKCRKKGQAIRMKKWKLKHKST